MRWIVALLTIFITSQVVAESCDALFFEGRRPAIWDKSSPQICYTDFAVFAGKTRSALASAEHLTKEKIYAARKIKRNNDFHEELALSTTYRAELDDYHHSSYDRGHLSPSADMSTKKAQYESFSLINMIPQNPINNRTLWENIEQVTRQLAIEEGEIYIVTGPIYSRNSTFINGRVVVPEMLYKAIYIPATRQAGVYIVKNDDDYEYKVISPAQLKEIAGIDPFPTLPTIIKEAATDLPDPHQVRRNTDYSSSNFYQSMPGYSPKHKVINSMVRNILGL